MPVDNTGKPVHAPSRRTTRRIIDEEDLELKRLKGEVSCAECRRLKLRCDKKVPCSSCVRRGCPSICPNGALSSGQGTRFILADTSSLHQKISDMSARIRSLEDALAIVQSSITPERHPLLSDDLLKIKFGLEVRGQGNDPYVSDNQGEGEGEGRVASSDNAKTEHTIDALGVLTLGEQGEMKYFGRSAGPETLLAAGDTWEDVSNASRPSSPSFADNPHLPCAVLGATVPSFFEGVEAINVQGTLANIMDSLPTRERAWALCEAFMDHASWFFKPFSREEMVQEFMVPIYRAKELLDGDGKCGDGEVDVHPHALAALVFTLALGALVDLSIEPYNAEAHGYYTLGRAALGMQSVFDSPELDTIRAVALMSQYNSMADRERTRESAWSSMALAAKLGQSIGLHRDSARWGLDDKTVQKRRSLFWEIHTAEVSVSLALGRPPVNHLSFVDCEFPFDEDSAVDENGEKMPSFQWWKHTFARDVFSLVIENTLTAQPPSYSGTILDLDRRVRQMSFPTSFKPYAMPGDKDYNSASVSIRSFYLAQHRTVTMMYIHRNFFAQAMLDHPDNPLRSPFAPSFLAAYRSASIIIKAFVHQYERAPDLTLRIWFLLQHTFSAAVIVGSVVARAPSSSMAPSALIELGIAVDVFEKMAVYSNRARIALRVLKRLRDKAARAYAQFRTGAALPDAGRAGAQVDELALFGGRTSVIPGKFHRRSHQSESPSARGSSSSTQDTPSPPTQSAQSASQPYSTSPIATSSLMEYLDSLPGTEPPNEGGPGPLPHPWTLPFSWSDAMQAYDPSTFSMPDQTADLSTRTPMEDLFDQTPGSMNGLVHDAEIPSQLNFGQLPMPVPEQPVDADIMDLGLTQEPGNEEQWMSFMRDCGILDQNQSAGMSTGAGSDVRTFAVVPSFR